MIRLQASKDFETIALMANEIWHAHYPGIITTQQIDYMLARFYAIESLKQQYEEGQNFYLILNQSAEKEGFVSITDKQAGCYFIHKFYLKKRGKGLGSAVFNEILTMLQPKEIKLTVNRFNIQAINFYFKVGFVIEKAADFSIGNGFVMEDFVMQWQAKN